MTKEFYKTIWNELNDIFIDSVSDTKEKGHLSTSQRHAIIRLTGKKYEDKVFIQNGRPISFKKCKFKKSLE